MFVSTFFLGAVEGRGTLFIPENDPFLPPLGLTLIYLGLHKFTQRLLCSGALH